MLLHDTFEFYLFMQSNSFPTEKSEIFFNDPLIFEHALQTVAYYFSDDSLSLIVIHVKFSKKK